MRSRRCSFIRFSSLSARPARTLASRVDMYVRRMVVATRVEPKTSDEIRVLFFDLLHRAFDKNLILAGDASVSIGIDRYVGSISVFVSAVERGAPHTTVVRRRTKTAVHVKCHF